MTVQTFLDSLSLRVQRPGQQSARDIRLDLYWLLGLGLLLMGVGIGLRDPWPADEPRFALVARDMVRTGHWLIPMIGGDTYPDKPPLFFWLIAAVYSVTGTLRSAFLLPSLCAALGTLTLIYDLGRRLWTREVGLAAGLLLLLTIQFVWQGRQAQIDATECFWVTLSLYGLLRHLLLGPSWKWYCIGCAAAGFGIITKGVGFLPLLVLIPYATLRAAHWSPRPALKGGWRWALGPLCMVVAIGVWFVPMLVASFSDPHLAAYRDEILFHQTVTRYASAWHHVEPFWFFLVEVIPPLWLPGAALLPWLLPRWRHALKQRDLRVGLLLSWVGLVVVFFSLSSGKRGVYVLPAVPAFCLVAAPWLHELLQRRGVRRVLLALAATVAASCLLAAGYALLAPTLRTQVFTRYGIDAPGPLLTIGLVSACVCMVAGLRHAMLAWLSALAVALVVVGVWINPVMNTVRSSERFIRSVEARTQSVKELGLVGYSEQYLLEFKRPTINFGHARWREWDREVDDAAAWMAAAPGRALLLQDAGYRRCFAQAQVESVDEANDERWYLVQGMPDVECARRGNVATAKYYQP